MRQTCVQGTGCDTPNAEAEGLLPRKRLYVLAIDDFERLTNAAALEMRGSGNGYR